LRNIDNLNIPNEVVKICGFVLKNILEVVRSVKKEFCFLLHQLIRHLPYQILWDQYL